MFKDTKKNPMETTGFNFLKKFKGIELKAETETNHKG